MQEVRKRILQIIQERGQATVAELAEILGMAPVSVRHHLDILQGDGLIQVDGVRRRPGAGRPQHVYTLTPQAIEVFPKNYDGVLHHLLAELRASCSPAEMEGLVRRVAARMAAELADEVTAVATWEDRLDALVAALNERGYMARWEKDEQGYRVILANCPYAGLIDTFHEFCQLDLTMLSAWLPSTHAPALQETVREGASRCILIVPIPASVEAQGEKVPSVRSSA